MPHCVVYDCRNTSGRTGNKEKGIYFHQFPKRERSPKRYAKWLNFCNRKTFTPKESSCICSKHFETSDFDESQLLKIRLMPHAKLKGPTLKLGAIPTQINSNAKRKRSNEHRKSIVQEIFQNANAEMKPTLSIHSNMKRKSARKVQSETKRKVRTNGNIESIEVQKEEDILKIANENLKSLNTHKGTQCELGIESYRNIIIASGLKSESCSNINLVPSSDILSENIKETLHLIKMSLCPWIRTPLTDLTGSIINNQWRSDCSSAELKVLDCYEAYGLDKGAIKCETLLKDFQECVGKKKQYERVDIMRYERHRQIKKGENTYAPGPIPHVY